MEPEFEDEAGDEAGASYADVAYARIREAIASGAYQPGERLTETALAAQLRTSRTPVREAVRRLESDGLVTRAGRGVLVPRLRPAEVVQLYQLRAALEALTAGLAAERVALGAVAASDLERLRGHGRDFEAAGAAGGVPAMVRANRALHRAIAELAGNAFARDALLRIWDHVASVTRAGQSHRRIHRLQPRLRASGGDRARGLDRLCALGPTAG